MFCLRAVTLKKQNVARYNLYTSDHDAPRNARFEGIDVLNHAIDIIPHGIISMIMPCQSLYLLYV